MAATLVSLLALAGAASALFPDCVNGPLKNNTVCDTSASVIDRATALVNAMTLAEKFNNTGNTAPGVPRLGLPAYQWWQEALVRRPLLLNLEDTDLSSTVLPNLPVSTLVAKGIILMRRRFPNLY